MAPESTFISLGFLYSEIMGGEAGPRGGLGGPPQKSSSTLCPGLGPTLLMSPHPRHWVLAEPALPLETLLGQNQSQAAVASLAL